MDSKRTRVSTTISSLPDSVICHILSFLPTEESVRTRVLSTRWKHLFSLVPVFDFKFDLSTNSTDTSSAPSDRIKRFLDFVDWVFNSYSAHPLEKFCFKATGLSSSSLQETSRVLSWISESIRLEVRKLDVSMYFKLPLTLPHDVFNCETLTDLKISGNFVLDVPDGACLPRVKNIWLFSTSFVDCHSARKLFKSCPVLEILLLCLSHTEDIQVIDISTPTLKGVLLLNYNDNYELVLNAPNLEYLEYMGYVPHIVYSDHGLKSLVKAFIACPSHFYDIYDPLEKILSVVCHVRVLRICTYTLESLQRSNCSLPIFHNLTRLEIKVVSSFDSGFIVHLLLAMPSLEVLVVENDAYDNQHSHLFPEDVPPCVSRHLKEVNFMGFFMMEHEYNLVEYFLKNAEVLDTLKIESNDSVENQFEMSMELLTFHRYSRTCQIVLT